MRELSYGDTDELGVSTLTSSSVFAYSVFRQSLTSAVLQTKFTKRTQKDIESSGGCEKAGVPGFRLVVRVQPLPDRVCGGSNGIGRSIIMATIRFWYPERDTRTKFY